MGEYAIRLSDDQEVKIGTCENMYYLRFEDRFKVRPLKGNVDPAKEAHELRFRLPFPDEDGIPIGEYEPFRGERLSRNNDDFIKANLAEDPGTLQLTHPSGLLVNSVCYHGMKLPQAGGDFKPFWNGKSWFIELNFVRGIRIENQLRLLPVIECRFCRQAWRSTWAEILDFVQDSQLRDRLAIYAAFPGDK